MSRHGTRYTSPETVDDMEQFFPVWREDINDAAADERGTCMKYMARVFCYYHVIHDLPWNMMQAMWKIYVKSVRCN